MKNQIDRFSETLHVSSAAQSISAVSTNSTSLQGETDLKERMCHNRSELMAGSTLQKWVRTQKWYEDTFNCKFDEESGDTIMQNICDYVVDEKTKKVMTNWELLCDMYALLKIHGCTMEILSHKNESQKELGHVFSKQQEIDCQQGKLHGLVSISDLDLRHMINSSMQQNGGVGRSDINKILSHFYWIIY